MSAGPVSAGSTADAGTQSKTLLLGCLIGVAGGLAAVPWIGVYGRLTDAGIPEVAREISAVGGTFVLGGPFVTESVAAGIAIHMLAAIGLGIALAFGCQTLCSRERNPMDGFVCFMLAALSTLAVVGAIVGVFIDIASATAHPDKVLVF
jgi:hypothetical protein